MHQTHKDCLKKKSQAMSTLIPKVTHLECRVDTFRRQLDTNHEEVVTHGQILEELMASENDDNESCD